MDELLATLDPNWLPAGTMVGPYEVVERLGAGGYGTVYRASRDGAQFALKLSRLKLSSLQGELRERQEARFGREAGILIQLRHPNIVRVYECARWPDFNGHIYLVMDLIKGLRLYDWCDKARPSLRRICEVVKSISLALAEAHARGAFHRDIKQENIVVDVEGNPWLIDWNIAFSRTATSVTQDHTNLGTCANFAPEYCRHIQLNTKAPFAISAATELHQVGFVFYELLTRETPFGYEPGPEPKNDNEAEEQLNRAIAQITGVSPTLPSLINPNIPRALEQIVMRLLEKKPENRFASAGELVKAIDEALANADASWDEPFDIPETPEPAEPKLLPALQRAPAAARPAQAPAQPREAAEVATRVDTFRAPGSNEPPSTFAPPEESVAPAARAATAPAKSEVPASKRVELQPSSGASWISRNKAIVVAGAAAVGLAALTLLGAKKPPQRETLLAHVQREEKALAIPSSPPEAPKEALVSTLPPPLAMKPAPSDATRVGQVSGARPLAAKERERKPVQAMRPPPSDEKEIDAEIARTYGRPTVPPAAPVAEERPRYATGLMFGRRIASSEESAPTGPFGVQTGARIRVRLDINLDSRTIGAGPAIAKLVRSYIADSRIVIPSGTMVYGDARAAGGRFTIRFSRLVLPSKREVPFEGIALDLQERKPGLAPGRRILVAQQRESTGERAGKAVANTALTAVSGGLAQDAARNAAEVALNAPSRDDSSSTGEAILLDAGADFDILVSKPF